MTPNEKRVLGCVQEMAAEIRHLELQVTWAKTDAEQAAKTLADFSVDFNQRLAQIHPLPARWKGQGWH